MNITFFFVCIIYFIYFQGINVHAEDLIKDPSHIPFVKDRNMVLFCWGEDINHSAVIRSLKEQGVDGVIYDK